MLRGRANRKNRPDQSVIKGYGKNAASQLVGGEALLMSARHGLPGRLKRPRHHHPSRSGRCERYRSPRAKAAVARRIEANTENKEAQDSQPRLLILLEYRTTANDGEHLIGGEGVRESAKNISLSSNGYLVNGLTVPHTHPQPLGGLERKHTDNRGRVLQTAKCYQIFFIPRGSEGFTSSSDRSELTSTKRRLPTVVVMRCPVPINS